MTRFTAPTEDEVVSAVRRVMTIGLGSAQDESLIALQAIQQALQSGTGAMSLRQLLTQAIERCEDDARAHLPTLLDIERTGRGAKERYEEVARATGKALDTIRTEKRRDWSRLLARTLLAMFEEAVERHRGRFEVTSDLRDRIATLCTLAALQLAALRRRDGSWAAAPGRDTGELSVTSRAGASLHKAFGATWATAALSDTLDWVGRHHDEQRGGWGHRVADELPPGWPKEANINVGPRQTASAMKLVYQFVGPHHRSVGRGVKYLIEHPAKGGDGWSTTGDDAEPDVLTTAYVIDALCRVQRDLRHLETGLDRSEYALINQRFETVLGRGLDWLRGRCEHGGWSAGGAAHAEPDPFVTAQVLGFAWQTIVPQPDRTIEYLSRLCDDGGVPQEVGGPAEIAPTAMALLGVLRATDRGHEKMLRKGAWHLGRAASEQGLSLDVFAATFALLLGQPSYDWLSGADWQERAQAGVEVILEGTREARPEAEIATAAVAQLEPKHRHVEPLLVKTMEAR